LLETVSKAVVKYPLSVLVENGADFSNIPILSMTNHD